MASPFTIAKRLFLASLIACSTIGSLGSVAQAEQKLSIGSAAPALNIEHWMSDGQGKFKPVTKFEDGKVYVVEFWATWCGPCVMSMPHLAQLQKDYADKGVQIISISDEDKETVTEFLDQEIPADDESEEKAKDAPKTYRELTAAYSLTTDPDQSSHQDYMAAAEQNGIPCAFIVGKDQKIEWIGHPMEMDEPLTQVVEGKWDREAFIAKFNIEKEIRQSFGKIQRSLQANKPDEALTQIDEAIAKLKEAKITSYDRPLQLTRFQILLQDKKFADQQSAAFENALKFAEEPEFVNFLAWAVYEATEEGGVTDKALIKKARVAAEGAAKKVEGGAKAAILDTVAHLIHKEGDAAAALKIQQEAYDIADEETQADLKEFLDLLKEEVK